MEKRELVILGAGPAGLTAAIYARRAALDALVVEKGLPGGQIRTTAEIENWPGLLQSTGAGLADDLRKHAERFKPDFLAADIKGLRPEGDRWIATLSTGEIEAGAVIVATGAVLRRLGCPGEEKFIGRGVSFCAVCDAKFFVDETVAVVGGGNAALEESLYLARFAKKVHIIHRRGEFRADPLVRQRAARDEKLVPELDSVVEAIEGGDLVERVRLKNVKTGELRTLEVSGVFMFVGVLPQADFLGDLLERREGGWIATDRYLATSAPGVFAAGDVRDTPLRQAISAAADGALAAMSAYSYLESRK